MFVPMPFRVSSDRRRAVAEAVVRANWDKAQGCFDLNMSDGTMRFRACMPIMDGAVGGDPYNLP